MQFTEEQRKIIDRLLEEADERQKQPGSRYYTSDEIRREIKELYNRSLQGNIYRRSTNEY